MVAIIKSVLRADLNRQSALFAFHASVRPALVELLAVPVTPETLARYNSRHSAAVRKFRQATAAERETWRDELTDVYRHAPRGKAAGRV